MYRGETSPALYVHHFLPTCPAEFLKKAMQKTFWERKRYEFAFLLERKVPWCLQLHGKL